MSPERIAILGAGMAGLGAGAALEAWRPVIYEKNPYWGGHTASHWCQGFVFDEGPHLSFTKNERVREIFARGAQGRYLEHSGIAANYFQGCRLKHPAQHHLFPLPTDIKKRCLLDFIEARGQASNAAPPANYRDWCYQNFGRSFSEMFVRKYTRKYWVHELEDLTTDWVGPRVASPTLEQVIEGALGESEANHNYITRFRYPLEGGFQSFAAGLASGLDIRTGYSLVSLDPKRKLLSFASKKSEHYDFLISSMPLPELVNAIVDAPSSVREAASRLKCTSHFLINVGLQGESTDPAYWLYYYDEDVPFSRVSFPSRLSPRNAPPGHWSLQAEIVHSPEKPLGNAESAVERGLDALQKVGLVRDRSALVYVGSQDIRYANVVFDATRTAAVQVIHDYLRDLDILPCGRYGEWAYLWTDDSLLSGEKAAERIRARLSGTLVANT